LKTKFATRKEDITTIYEVSDEECWRDYFVSPLNWWDNRMNKQNPKASNFKHKVTRMALWIDGWFAPQWVKDRFLI
jgi:hypothetical protein